MYISNVHLITEVSWQSKRQAIPGKKLLSAACDVFVEMGFRDATVAEICRRAGANISAVNYHFGSKETLYQQAGGTPSRNPSGFHPRTAG